MLHNQGNKISQDGPAGKDSSFWVQTFRMPLDAENGQAFVGDRLRAEILGTVLHDSQSASGSADGLVMGAVYNGVRPVQVIQPGASFYDRGMVLVAVLIFVVLRRRQVLYNGAA